MMATSALAITRRSGTYNATQRFPITRIGQTAYLTEDFRKMKRLLVGATKSVPLTISDGNRGHVFLIGDFIKYTSRTKVGYTEEGKPGRLKFAVAAESSLVT